MKMNKWYLLVIITIAGLILGKTLGVSADALQDSQLILPLSKQLTEGNQKVLIKHFSPYKKFSNEDEFLKIGDELSRTFNLPCGSVKIHDGEHFIYNTTKDLSDDLSLTLLFMGMNQDHSSNLFIKLETESEKGLITIAQVQNELEKQLHSIGLSSNWNIIVQGTLASGYSDLRQLDHWLEQNLNVKEIEKYTDSGTISVSYYSPKIHHTIETQNQKMNVQLAIHRNSITDQWKVTMGTPVITIEY